MEVNAEMITKQLINKIPQSAIVIGACAFILIGVVYWAWENSDPNKQSTEEELSKENAKSQHQEDIKDKRDELFDRILR